MLFIAACSDDDDGGDSGATETLAPTGAPTPDGDDDTASDSLEVTIAGFAFSPNEYRVLAGETVTFTITNSDGVTHNMHIATNVVPDGEALAGDYTGSRCDGAVDPCSDPPAISGGEAAVLEWAVPQETGAVRFRCDFHPTSMVGKIIIE
jgi:plastocyanin